VSALFLSGHYESATRTRGHEVGGPRGAVGSGQSVGFPGESREHPYCYHSPILSQEPITHSSSTTTSFIHKNQSPIHPSTRASNSSAPTAVYPKPARLLTWQASEGPASPPTLVHQLHTPLPIQPLCPDSRSRRRNFPSLRFPLLSQFLISVKI
jgi:hypothetical protein